MRQVPDGFVKTPLDDLNEVCGFYEGPGETGGVDLIICDSPIRAKHITFQIMKDIGVLQVNEVWVNK